MHRSGSSMMMACLEAAGVPVAYDDSNETLNMNYSDYLPNPGGFYGLNTDFTSPFFPQIFANQALKFPFRFLAGLPKGNYQLLFLKRNPDEIRASMQAFMPFMPWGDDAGILEFYEIFVNALLEQVKERGDTIITILNYADIVSDPTTAFNTLVAAGWPLNDVSAAISVVDPTLKRFNLEQK